MNNYENPADLVLTTYFRSGSNFLFAHIYQTSNIIVHKTHEQTTESVPKATIVRKAEECIASALSMWFYYEKSIDKTSPIKKIVDIYGPEIEKLIYKYVEFYKYTEDVDYVFSFEKVVSSPDLVVDKLCKLLNKQRLAIEPELVNFPPSSSERIFLTSSRPLSHYEDFKEKVKQYDLSECKSLYEKVLSRAIF